MIPDHINPMQWNQAIGVARQSCARIFRDGGLPKDALNAFGLGTEEAGMQDGGLEWSRAVEAIARSLCEPQMLQRAA